MTDVLRLAHDAKLREIADKYARAGYQVAIEPSPKQLPFELTDYQPDLVARRGEEGLIVEVKSSAGKMPVDRLRAVAEQVSHHAGWRFLLIPADDSLETGLPGIDEESLHWPEIVERVQQARRLESTNECEAAFIVLWIAFEQMLRLRAIQVALPVERLSPSVLIRHLYSQGELSMPQFDAAMACLHTRNRVIHGIKSSELPASMDQLKQLVEELIAEFEMEPGTASAI